MNSSTETSFRSAAEEMGLKHKLLYTLNEVSRVTGIAYSTLLDECNAGRLRFFLPNGRRQGRLVRPEWVDEWIDGGVVSDGQAA